MGHLIFILLDIYIVVTFIVWWSFLFDEDTRYQNGFWRKAAVVLYALPVSAFWPWYV